MSEKRLNILEGIEKGISPSYLGAFNTVVNLDTDSVPGAVMVNFKLKNQFPRADTVVLENVVIGSVSSGDDTLTLIQTVNPIENLFTKQAVKFTTTGTLPAPLSTSTVYYLTNINNANHTIQLATTILNADNGTPIIDITNTGSGTHTMVIQKIGAITDIIETGISYIPRYASDDNGKVWVDFGGQGNWTMITGNSTGTIEKLQIYKDYLFSFGYNDIDVYGPLTSVGDTATWTNNWESGLLTSSSYHPSLLGQDDTVYVGAGSKIASFNETTGETFDPATNTTYDVNSSALDLPSDITVTHLEELGYSLIIGSANKIYTWDRISPSFDFPLILNDSMAAMRVYNNILYYIDVNGKIFATNGTSINKIGEFPMSTFNAQQGLSSNLINITSRIGIYKGKLMFGIYSFSSTAGSGVYSFNPNTGKIVLEYTAPNGDNDVDVRFYCYDNIYYMYNGNLTTNYRSQIVSIYGYTTNVYRNVLSWLETGLRTYGDKYQPTTFRFFEIQLGKELNQSYADINLYYRNNITDSYTLIGTFSYSEGAMASKIIENSSVSGDQIQFKVEINCGANISSTPEIKAIYIY